MVFFHFLFNMTLTPHTSLFYQWNSVYFTYMGYTYKNVFGTKLKRINQILD